MGRRSTGAWITNECQKIKLSNLLKWGHFKKGEKHISNTFWTNHRGKETGRIQILSVRDDKEIYLRLMYTLNDRRKGQSYDYDYKIYLTTVPSNLGKGEVLYFVCPVSGKRCRILYCAYGYHKWKSREAYKHRIYYSYQADSKYNYANSRYWALDRAIKKFKEQETFRWVYDGKYTKKALKLLKMEEKQREWDKLRWTDLFMNLEMRLAMRSGQYDDFLPAKE